MDAAWKVYVGDRRFDDNQISNLFLKLKYETVGRFTFDFRPIDGDESYMVVNNTLRIFWGDLHKLDGVIQRVDWDDSQYCYHVFGADIRGFLLDRVNTEPSTVSSYTSDIQTQVQYTGCDFPSNIWTGAGDKIGTYTFHYKLGIQNTIRITGATQNIWHNVIERGTVYEHQNGCLYDATKAWAANQYAGATLRFVSGACKNNVYNVNGNSSNRVCIRLPGESASLYETDEFRCETIGGVPMYRVNDVRRFSGDVGEWIFTGAWADSHHCCLGETSPFSNVQDPAWGYETGGLEARMGATLFVSTDVPTGMTGNSFGLRQVLMDTAGGGYGVNGWGCIGGIEMHMNSWDFPTVTTPGTVYGRVRFWAKSTIADKVEIDITDTSIGLSIATTNIDTDLATVWKYWDIPITLNNGTQGATRRFNIRASCLDYSYWRHTAHADYDVLIYNPEVFVDKRMFPTAACGVGGTVPGCSRLGDIYEIVTATMERIEPASLSPATLEKDNHIVKYNQTEELSDRTTVVTVMGAD